MRLIDADEYKGKVIASHCYSGVNKIIRVDDIPTAYDIDNEIKSYNQALEDAEKRYREWLKSEYGMVADDDKLTIRVLRSLMK